MILVRFLLIVLCMVSLGCGGGSRDLSIPAGAIVAGRIVLNGEPLKVERPEIGLGYVELHLIPANQPSEQGVIETTRTDARGTFQFQGNGNGVPAGAYRLSVYQRSKGPDTDDLQGKFSDAASPISVNVPAEKLNGTVDLGVVDLAKK